MTKGWSASCANLHDRIDTPWPDRTTAGPPPLSDDEESCTVWSDLNRERVPRKHAAQVAAAAPRLQTLPVLWASSQGRTGRDGPWPQGRTAKTRAPNPCPNKIAGRAARAVDLGTATPEQIARQFPAHSGQSVNRCWKAGTRGRMARLNRRWPLCR